MKKIVTIISTMLFLGALSAFGYWLYCQGENRSASQGYAKILPKDTLLTIRLMDIDQFAETYPLGAKEKSIHAVIQMISDLYLGGGSGVSRQNIDENIEYLTKIFGQDLVFAILGNKEQTSTELNSETLQNRLAIIVNSQSSKLINLIASNLPQVNMSEINLDGISIQKYVLDDGRELFGLQIGDRYVFGLSPNIFKYVKEPTSNEEMLSEDKSFLNTTKWWGSFDKNKVYVHIYSNSKLVSEEIAQLKEVQENAQLKNAFEQQLVNLITDHGIVYSDEKLLVIKSQGQISKDVNTKSNKSFNLESIPNDLLGYFWFVPPKNFQEIADKFKDGDFKKYNEFIKSLFVNIGNEINFFLIQGDKNPMLPRIPKATFIVNMKEGEGKEKFYEETENLLEKAFATAGSKRMIGDKDFLVWDSAPLTFLHTYIHGGNEQFIISLGSQSASKILEAKKSKSSVITPQVIKYLNKANIGIWYINTQPLIKILNDSLPSIEMVLAMQGKDASDLKKLNVYSKLFQNVRSISMANSKEEQKLDSHVLLEFDMEPKEETAKEPK